MKRCAMNKVINTFLGMLVGLLICVPSLFAQRTITLEECLRIAHSQSPALFEAKKKYDIARTNTEGNVRTTLNTKIDLTLQVPIYSDNTSLTYNPVTGSNELLPFKSTQFGPGLSITQPIELTGGSLTLNGYIYRQSQIPAIGAQTNDYLEYSTIQLNQPIFKANQLAIVSQESQMALEDALAQYTTQWASLNYTIENSFYTLYQAEQNFQIQQDVVATSDSNYVLADNKFKAGLIAEVDKLQLEADLAAAQTDLFDKQRQCAAAQRDLEIALALPFSDSLTAKLDTLPEINVSIDRESAMQAALANREDVLSDRQAIIKNHDALDLTGNQRTIYASLTGSFGTSGEAQFAQLGQDPYLFLNRGLTLSVTIPIFDWGAHSLLMEAAQSSIDLSQTELDVKERQVRQEVLNAIDQIEAAKKQVEVAKKSVEVAEKAYDLSRNRFDLGKITSQDLSLDQQRVSRARVAALTAEVAEHLALADLTQKTLFDFETGKRVTPEFGR